MLSIFKQPSGNDFESEVVRAIRDAWRDPDLANEEAHLFGNLLLPHPVERLPNEHDVVIFAAFGGFTIDAKAMAPGRYRGNQQRALEWAPAGAVSFRRLTERLAWPFDTAFKKSKVLLSFVSSPPNAMPAAWPINSIIVVPDQADIDQVHDRRALANGTGLSFINLRELKPTLVAAARGCRQRPETRRRWAPLIEATARRIGGEPPAQRTLAGCELSTRLDMTATPVLAESWKARHSQFGHEAFLKVFYKHPWSEVSPSYFKQLNRQMEILRQARHPNLIALRSHEDSPDGVVLEFEYFTGQTLEARVESLGPLAIAASLDMVARLSDAIEHLHQLKGRHRALDPRSLLLGDPDARDFRVIRFSSLNVVGRSTVPRHLPDSIFAPPELRDGGDPAARGPTVDVYGAGRLLQYALVGERMPGSHSDTGWQTGLPSDIVDVVTRAVALEPRARFPTLRALGEAIRSCAKVAPAMG